VSIVLGRLRGEVRSEKGEVKSEKAKKLTASVSFVTTLTPTRSLEGGESFDMS
jgi:hypothetical protein